MNVARTTVALLLAALLLLGCGQKGQLYLPDENDRPPAGAN
ncbi:MAG: lipoprotein [Gammaproteobacteria bacterium]|nr:lipoprotein [Gammaproteobacteria bacterium]